MPLLPTIFCRPETRDGNRSLNNALHNRYFFGIRWLIWNRHANIDLQDKQGYRPIDRCLIRLVTASEEYDELQKTDPLDRLIKTPFEHIQGDDSYALLIISCMDNRLDLRGYAHRFSKAVTLVENNPQLAENKDSEEFHYTVETPPANGLSIHCECRLKT